MSRITRQRLIDIAERMLDRAIDTGDLFGQIMWFQRWVALVD